MSSYSLCDIKSHENVGTTFLDPNLVTLVQQQVQKLVTRKADIFLKSFLEISTESGMFAPFKSLNSPSIRSSKSGTLTLDLSPCHLIFMPTEKRVSLSIQDEHIEINLTLNLLAQPVSHPSPRSSGVSGLILCKGETDELCTVKIDGKPQVISSMHQTWLEHFWGSWPQRKQLRQYYLPETNRFVLQMQDKSTLMVIQTPSDTNAFHLKTNQFTFEHLGSVSLKATDLFESMRTFNSYDMNWLLKMPGSERLEIVPIQPFVEVPVFSLRRGFQQPGCRVEGHFNGKPCKGFGFTEIFGKELDINQFFWGKDKTTLSDRLESFVPRTYDAAWLQRICGSDQPLDLEPEKVESALLDPIWSMMDRGGKGWRATWLALSLHALGWDDPRFLDLLPVIELIHTGSLVIDDIQDESRMRRGKPALHHQIGTDLAINAGNFLYFLPLILIQEADWLSEGQRLRIFEAIAIGLRQGHIGQGIDLSWSKGRLDLAEKTSVLEPGRSQLLEQYRLKSGSQLESIAKIAGIVSNAPDDQVAALVNYSKVFGIVFQIMDDLIDVQQGFEKLGKDEFEDLKNGRLNMVLLYTLSAVSSQQRDSLIRSMTRGRTSDNVSHVRRLIKETKAAQRCITFAEELMETAWQPMSILPATDAKIALRSVPLWLLEQSQPEKDA